MTIKENKDESRIKNSEEDKRISSDLKRNFSVRQMEIQDLYEVYNLGESCFRADLWPMLYRGWDEYEVTHMFNTDGDYCLVAENDDFKNGKTPHDERIVGFILGTVMSKPGSAWSYGYVVWLCAHPSWQREGVASKLMDKIVEIFVENNGVRIVMADTDPSNEKAVNFFKKKGLEQERQHVFLTSNIQSNHLYSHLLHKSRAAAIEERYFKKMRRLALKTPVISPLKKKKNDKIKAEKISFQLKKKKKKKKKK